MSTVATNDKPVVNLELTEAENMQMIFEELRSAKFHIPVTFSTRVGTWPALRRHSSAPNMRASRIRRQPAGAGDFEIHRRSSTPVALPRNPRELPEVPEQNGHPSCSPAPDHEVSVAKYARHEASLQENDAGKSTDEQNGSDASPCASVKPAAPELPATSAKVRELAGDRSGRGRWSSAPNISVSFELTDTQKPANLGECSETCGQKSADDSVRPKRRRNMWSRTKRFVRRMFCCAVV